MFASAKPFIYFFCIYCSLLVLFSSTSFVSPHNQDSVSHSTDFRTILSRAAIDTINRDPRIENALLELTEAIARSSRDMGRRVGSESLAAFGTNLTGEVVQLRALHRQKWKKRGFLDDIGQSLSQLFGGGDGKGGFDLAGALTGLFGNVGNGLIETLNTPSLFLGIGLGMGTATGLNLTTMEEAKDQAQKVASAFQASSTGLNSVAQNLGTGLAGQIAPALGGAGDIPIGPAVFALAQGLGNATAMGFNLTQEKFLPINDSSIESIAGNFGLGLAMPIVTKIDIQGLMNGFGQGNSKILEQLPEIAAAAGKGLGEGAKTGLGLQTNTPSAPTKMKRQEASPLDGLNIPDIVGSFTKGLSQAFLQDVDLKNLNPAGGLNMTDLKTQLRPLAAGAGAGIGKGFAVGLNLKGADSPVMLGTNITGEDQDTALIAEGFTQNLVSNFLMNSSAFEKVGEIFSSNEPSMLDGIDAAKAAEGFARGTIEGVLNAMSSVGGIKNLINGDVPPDAFGKVPVLEPTTFDDTLNGSAVSFARGLTGEGTIVVAEIIRNLTGNAREPTTNSRLKIRVADTPASLSSRQSSDSPFLNLPLAIDAGTVEFVGQKAIDLLTCQGIAGVASIGSVLLNGGQDLKDGFGLDENIMKTLPEAPVTLSSGGNIYKIVLRRSTIEINGHKSQSFITITALHVVFTSLAFMVFLPLYIMFGIAWRLAKLIGYPIDGKKNKKWRIGFLVAFVFFGLLGVFLGVAGIGTSRHFRDAHGITGLILLLILLPTLGFTIQRLRTKVPFPIPSEVSSIKSSFALLKTPQRIFIISGALLQVILGLGLLVFIQGFSTLRAVSLCLIDVVLTSPMVATLVAFALMLQTGAMTMTIVRVCAEYHIGRREAAGIDRTEAGSKLGHDSDRSFGNFEKELPPKPQSPPKKNKDGGHRRTEELMGYADNGISAPFNVRKDGLMSPVVTGPKSDGVTTADLFPPPAEAQSQPRLTSYSRPFGGPTYSR